MEFQLRGHDVHESIPGARTTAQAERAESAIREAIYNGRYNKATKTSRVSDFVDEVYRPGAKQNKAAWEDDESRSQSLKQFFGNRPIRDITPMLVRRLKGELSNEKTIRYTSPERKERMTRKAATVNRYLRLLSKILSMAYEEGLINANPVSRVKLDLEGDGRERYLTYEEEERLLRHLTNKCTHLYAPVVIDIDAGMRVNSEMMMQIEHCNFGNR